jgi:pyridoxamine 5'-phosphate oxidase
MNFDFKANPFDLFSKFINTAQVKGIPEHNAMSLATVNSENRPSNRIVYYKGLIRGGFSFYTNYLGHKGTDLEENKYCSANFFWPHLDQQIRIDGYVEKLTAEESDRYFQSRARASQIGAWASLQSQTLRDFAEFETRFIHYESEFINREVPRPPHWGGFSIQPLELEFWFGKTGRLHQRYIYQRVDCESEWNRFMRYP